ncbi:MAG: (d)CMP kinase [Cryobacterium sp.]|nr:(d)CMP kinase [Cryobacterium sp.]
MRFSVAVDGPAGSGKSSVSKAVARKLGFDYLDTGAAYRALAWLALEQDIDLDDAKQVIGLLEHFEFQIGLDPDSYFVRVGTTDVTEEIRRPRIHSAVSAIARVPEVRAYLNSMFRGLIANGSRPGIITEGRDITTVVAPDAPVRVLLTASEQVRQSRRARELGKPLDHEETKVGNRDAQDLKVVDFINPAPGVTVIDSTDLTFDATVSALTFIIQEFLGREG